MSEQFKIIGKIDLIEIIAIGGRIRGIRRLRKSYGPGRWRKLKGTALVSLPNGRIRHVELHWYEAHGIGRRELKIKKYLND
jgi:hypothetical protein